MSRSRHESEVDSVGEGDIEFEEAEIADLEDENGEIDVSKLVKKEKKLAELPSQKRRVTRKIPKLDEERLCSEKGVSALPKLFENVKFKGKGYEIQDLNYTMGVIEYWAHRLMPSMPFDSVIDRCEHLGKKRRLQVFRHKLRSGLPVNNEEFVSDAVLRAEAEEERAERVEREEFRETVAGTSGFIAPDLGDNVIVEPSPQPTAEQLERIEANKRRALKLREERRLREIINQTKATGHTTTESQPLSMEETSHNSDDRSRPAAQVRHDIPDENDLRDLENEAQMEEMLDEDAYLAEFE